MSEARICCEMAEGWASFSLNTDSITDSSVLVVSWPVKAHQSLTTIPAPITSVPRLTVPATKGIWRAERLFGYPTSISWILPGEGSWALPNLWQKFWEKEDHHCWKGHSSFPPVKSSWKYRNASNQYNNFWEWDWKRNASISVFLSHPSKDRHLWVHSEGYLAVWKSSITSYQ